MSVTERLQQYLYALDAKMAVPTNPPPAGFWPACTQYHLDLLRVLGWRWKQELGREWQHLWQEAQTQWQNLKATWNQPIPALTLQQGPDRPPVLYPYEDLMKQWQNENAQQIQRQQQQRELPERHIQRYQKMWQHYIQSLHEDAATWQQWRQQVHAALTERKTRWQQHIQDEFAWYEQNWQERLRTFTVQRELCQSCFNYHVQQIHQCAQTLQKTCAELHQTQLSYEAQNPCLHAWSKLWHAYETLWQAQAASWPQHVSLNQALLTQLLQSNSTVSDPFYVKQASHLALHLTYLLDYLRSTKDLMKPWLALQTDVQDFLALAQQQTEQFMQTPAYQFQETIQRMCQETQQTLLQIKQQFEVAFQNLWGPALAQQTQLQQDEITQRTFYQQAWQTYVTTWQQQFHALIQPVKESQPQISEIIKFLVQYEGEHLDFVLQQRQWQFQTWCLQQIGLLRVT